MSLFLEEVDDLLPEYVHYGAYISEQDLRTVIHEMSHQKVDADQKWGKRLMEPDMVETLYLMLNNYRYHNEDVYRAIL